jgi:hypothetical protein
MAAELADTAFAFAQCGFGRGNGWRHPRRTRKRDSAMLVLAKPMPAVTAKTKVATKIIHPTSAVPRWRLPEPSRTGGDNEGDQISGHAGGQKQPSSHIACPKLSRERPVHGDADAGQGEGSGHQQDPGNAP